MLITRADADVWAARKLPACLAVHLNGRTVWTDDRRAPAPIHRAINGHAGIVEKPSALAGLLSLLVLARRNMARGAYLPGDDYRTMREYLLHLRRSRHTADVNRLVWVNRFLRQMGEP